MGWPVVLTPQSQDDLREIVSFIARDSRDHARRFGHLLVDTALSLGEQPERGRVVPEQDDPAVREILRGAYRIIYEVVREPVRPTADRRTLRFLMTPTSFAAAKRALASGG